MTLATTTYRALQFKGDTRIDLLLRLYRAAIQRIEDATKLMESDADSVPARLTCLKAIELVQAIQLGLDTNQGTVPENIERLCDFVMRQLTRPTIQSLHDAKHVLETLRDGFESIREDAIRFEQEHIALQSAPAESMVDSLC